MLCDFGCFHSEIPQERMKTVKLKLIKKWASRYPCQISPNKAPTFDMTRLHTTSLESLIFLKRNLITFPYFRKVLAKTARQPWTQLPSHVSVKTLSSAIEIGIKNSFSSLNRVPKRFNHMSITTQHALRHQDGHHISLVPLPLEVPGPHSKAAKQEKSLDQNAHVYHYKIIFWG